MSKLDIVKRKARKLGLKGDIKYSTNKNKKFDYITNNKKISFGAKGYKDFIDTGDLQKRKAYRKRHAAIYNKHGQKAITIKNTPAYLSYKLLW